jgi:hypothetical protein
VVASTIAVAMATAKTRFAHALMDGVAKLATSSHALTIAMDEVLVCWVRAFATLLSMAFHASTVDV